MYKLDDLLICYNWMPLVADHAIDFPPEYYKDINRLHDKEMIEPDDVKNMKENDIIFVKTDFIVSGQFTKYWLDKIETPFNLITGVSSYQVGHDCSDPNNYKIILENKYLKNWFCTNPPKEEHEKIHPLPIGFSEPDRPSSDQRILKKLRKERKPFEEKINRLFIPWHDKTTNPDRHAIINRLKDKEYVESMQDKSEIEPYLKKMGEYRYTICVQGRGNDTHRNYESLLMGCVLITIDCTVKRLFDKYNLPGHFVNDWSEVNDEFFERISTQEYDFSNVEEFLQAKTHSDEIKEICGKS